MVFIAYGAIEALEGEAGLSRFSQGLNKLLDKIDQLGAKAILLSPVPMMSAESAENLVKRNAMLELYASAIAKTASDREKHFIDIFNPFLQYNKNAKLPDNGLHLNENGYYFLASTIEKGLGLAPRHVSVVINLSKHAAEATFPVKIPDSGKNNETVKFRIDEDYLPLPLPEQGGGTADNAWILRVEGLKRGFYTLARGDSEVITTSADKWKEGVEIRRGASFSQAVQVREKIIKRTNCFSTSTGRLTERISLNFDPTKKGGMQRAWRS